MSSSFWKIGQINFLKILTRLPESNSIETKRSTTMKWHFANVFATYLILYKLLHELVLLYRYQDLQIYIKCWSGRKVAKGIGRIIAKPVGSRIPIAKGRIEVIASATSTRARESCLSCTFMIISF